MKKTKKQKLWIRVLDHWADNIIYAKKALQERKDGFISLHNMYFYIDKIEVTGDNCPFCEKYSSSAHNPCSECPIKLHTGQPHCWGSPWMNAREQFDLIKEREEVPRQRSLALLILRFREEYTFLKSLSRSEVKDKEVYTLIDERIEENVTEPIGCLVF